MNRTLLACSLVSTLAACSSDPPGTGKRYVLVHGAWSSATAWAQVADRLRDNGAEVTALDLPGHGGDTTAATFSGYVAAVEAEVDAPGSPAILVGHSMAGIVVSQVASERANAVRGIVYLGAYLPADGQSLLDLSMMDAHSQLGPALAFDADGSIAVDPAQFPHLFCADCDATATAALVAGYHDEPGAPLQQPVSLGADFAGVHKTYLHTGNDLVVSGDLQAAMVAATPVDREVTLATSHMAMLAAPDDVADELLTE